MNTYGIEHLNTALCVYLLNAFAKFFFYLFLCITSATKKYLPPFWIFFLPTQGKARLDTFFSLSKLNHYLKLHVVFTQVIFL